MGWTKIADLKYLRGQSVFLSLPKTKALILYCRGWARKWKMNFF